MYPFHSLAINGTPRRNRTSHLHPTLRIGLEDRGRERRAKNISSWIYIYINITMNCINCQAETKNKKFCTRSCAASFNNKKTPKRVRKRKCAHCESIVRNYRSTLCDKHFNEYRASRTDHYRNKTVGEYRRLISVQGKHKSWTHAHIRLFARTWLKHLQKLPCNNCGYDKHVELCHIKPIRSFTDDCLLKDINSETNVIQLCRNCHWEFDNLKNNQINVTRKV